MSCGGVHTFGLECTRALNADDTQNATGEGRDVNINSTRLCDVCIFECDLLGRRRRTQTHLTYIVAHK